MANPPKRAGRVLLASLPEPEGVSALRVTPPFASLRAPPSRTTSPLPPKKTVFLTPRKRRKKNRLFGSPRRGLSVCYPGLADSKGCIKEMQPKTEKGDQIMTTTKTALPFPLGQIVSTPGVIAAVPNSLMMEALARHVRGDWGNVCPADAAENDKALVEGYRILSAYPIDPAKPAKGHGANVFWIITEADRSVTTFLLPEEY